MISNHGRDDDLISFATYIEDNERMLTLYIQRKDYGAAIHLLKNSSFTTVEKFIYKYSEILFSEDPENTIKMWIKQKLIKPTELLHCIGKNTDERHKVRYRYLLRQMLLNTFNTVCLT